MENGPVHYVLIGANLRYAQTQLRLELLQEGLAEKGKLTAQAANALWFSILQTGGTKQTPSATMTPWAKIDALPLIPVDSENEQADPINIHTFLTSLSDLTASEYTQQDAIRHALLIVDDQSYPCTKAKRNAVINLIQQPNVAKTKIHVLHKTADEQTKPIGKKATMAADFFERCAIFGGGQYIPFKHDSELEGIGKNLAKQLYRKPRAKSAELPRQRKQRNEPERAPR